MKFTTSSADLLAQLSVVSRVASTRSAVQALSGVQLAAADGGRGAARHGHGGRPARPAGRHHRARGHGRAPGAPAARHRPSLPGGDASLELRPAEQDVEILSGSATFHIRTLRAEDFPPLPEPGGDTVVQVPAARVVVRKVQPTLQLPPVRPTIWHIDHDQFSFVKDFTSISGVACLRAAAPGALSVLNRSAL